MMMEPFAFFHRETMVEYLVEETVQYAFDEMKY